MLVNLNIQVLPINNSGKSTYLTSIYLTSALAVIDATNFGSMVGFKMHICFSNFEEIVGPLKVKNVSIG